MPNFKLRPRRQLKFEFWSFFGIWSLVLGVFHAWGQDTAVQYLSGHGKDDAIPWRFECTTGTNSGYWTNLDVPSQWDVHGFGTVNYFKDLTNGWNEHGLYEHDFSVPADWSGKRVFLVFDGVMTDTKAEINGQSVGPMHQGGFYRFKYEVTPLLKYGDGDTNQLNVDVAKHSANASINGAERNGDFWPFGGIYRPVSLEAEPPQFIERVAIDAQASGAFAMDVYLNGVTNHSTLEAQIINTNGENVGDPFTVDWNGTTNDAGDLVAHVTGQTDSPRLWSAEYPNLYTVEVRLKQNGEIIHRIKQRFGFRTFEVRDGDGLYLNGKRVVLRGVDRHSFWPESGRTLSEAVQKLDTGLMKDANINAVRMSHYPPDAQFLDACDEVGLYVLDELAGWHHNYDNTVGPKLVKEMLVRDVNHPCILFWDNGNEGGFNTNLDHLFPEYDPQQRRVLHPWAAFHGVNTAHYLQYDQAEQACAGIPIYYHKNGKTFADTTNATIYMPTEFIHALYDGGGGAGLDDYWRLMLSSKYIGGGFIWAWTDDGLRRPDGSIDVAGNQAPDGIVGPYRQREASYFAVKEIWCPIQVTRESARRFKLENHFAFTDAHDCKFTWQLRKFSLPSEAAGFTVIRQGVAESPEIPPGGVGKLDIGPKAAAWSADALALSVEDPHGRELYTWVWQLKADAGEHLMAIPAEHHAVPTETNGMIVVNEDDLTVMFSKATGLLAGIQRGTQVYSLTNGPLLAMSNATLHSITFDVDGPDCFVSAKYDGAMKSVEWRVNGNGWVDCNYTYRAEGTNDYFGVTFDYPEALVLHKRWQGVGPYRVWKNRLRGQTAGVWENDYNDTLTGFRDWVYPEFKGFFANVHWLQLETKEGLITVVNHSGVPYMQVLTPDFPPAKLAAKAVAPAPKCGLGFMDGIPPIGSKFKEAIYGGPQGLPNVAQGDYSGSISFYFGDLPK